MHSPPIGEHPLAPVPASLRLPWQLPRVAPPVAAENVSGQFDCQAGAQTIAPFMIGDAFGGTNTTIRIGNPGTFGNAGAVL